MTGGKTGNAGLDWTLWWTFTECAPLPRKPICSIFLPGASLDRDAKEVIVVHGYHSGTALRDMVRKELRSPYIKERHPGFSDGQTILVLKKRIPPPR